jgi:hypothetical protein
MYFAGAEMLATYPLGPVMEGCGLNITVFSYQDNVDIGLVVCRELVPDVWDMAAGAGPAMAELLAAARTRSGASNGKAATAAAGQAAPAATGSSAKPAPTKRAGTKRAGTKATTARRATKASTATPATRKRAAATRAAKPKS